MIYTKYFSYPVYDINGKRNKNRVITKHVHDLHQAFFNILSVKLKERETRIE